MSELQFYDDCPACGRRILARTRLALRHKMFEHVPACIDKREKELRAELVRRRQLDLFGGGS